MSPSPSPIRPGCTAPDFELAASNGETVSLRDCIVEGPVLVEFIRGTWCPNARRRLDELAAARMRFRDLWARIVVVVCEDPFTVHRYFVKRPGPLTVLIDETRCVARAYGVHRRFALDHWNFARPSSFLIDRAGYVRHAHVARFQTDACPIETLLEEIVGFESEARRGDGPPAPAR